MDVCFLVSGDRLAWGLAVECSIGNCGTSSSKYPLVEEDNVVDVSPTVFPSLAFLTNPITVIKIRTTRRQTMPSKAI
jgi:hypothetical protein